MPGSKPFDLRQARNLFIYVLGIDVPGVGLGGRVLGEEFEHVLVLLPGELLAERLDVLQEALDRCGEREPFLFLDPGELKTTRAGFELETLSFLRFERFGGGVSSGGAKPPAVLAPFDEEAPARGPLDTAPRIPLEGDVAPTLGCLEPPQDVDPRHSATPWKSGHS